MDACSLDPQDSEEVEGHVSPGGSTRRRTVAAASPGETERCTDDVLGQQYIHVAEPSWFDATQPHYGAPEYLWMRCLTQLSPAAVDELLAHPQRLSAVLVETWRQWRATWIAGEWTR